MEIILKEDVQNLGFKNDIVTVKNGCLVPSSKANHQKMFVKIISASSMPSL